MDGAPLKLAGVLLEHPARPAFSVRMDGAPLKHADGETVDDVERYLLRPDGRSPIEAQVLVFFRLLTPSFSVRMDGAPLKPLDSELSEKLAQLPSPSGWTEPH